ncbi:MAG: trypsin-like peptidase domain-containing protein [Allorhizobium sp.]
MGDVVFPLFRRKNHTEIQIVGTAFFALSNGCFITAQHVIEDHTSLFALHFLPDLTYEMRAIFAAYHHPKSDISIGVLAPLQHRQTGRALKNNTVRLSPNGPAPGSKIVTYSYPLHDIHQTSDGVAINVQPDFYDGTLGELYSDRGPSGKLNCPYHMAELHLYGASSGGPVFSADGTAFSLASTSYDGAPDFAFLTPVYLSGEILIPEADIGDGTGKRSWPFREIVEFHHRNVNAAHKSSV